MAQAAVFTDIPVACRDLLEAAHVAVLGTIAPDGRPQLTAVWYLLEDGALRLTVRGDRKKLRNMKERDVATFFLMDPANPLRSLEVRATVDVTADPDYEFTDRISRKYGGDLRTFDGPEHRRFVVTLRPDRVTYRG